MSDCGQGSNPSDGPSPTPAPTPPGTAAPSLRELNPEPHYKQKHHQWLEKFGRQTVHDHLQRVITVMKLCNDMKDFWKKFERVFSKSPLQESFSFMESEA